MILVEGIAEQIIVPLLFEQDHGQTLESVGCSVINVGGVAFSHFLTVMKNGLYRKCVVLTDSDTGTRTEKRAGHLKRDFDDGVAISVQITEDATFEKDLFAANREGDGRALLLKAVKATRPKAGAQYAKELGKAPIDVDGLFKLTEGFKAEFAFNLASQMVDTKTTLTTPQYIADALSFIAPHDGKVGG